MKGRLDLHVGVNIESLTPNIRSRPRAGLPNRRQLPGKVSEPYWQKLHNRFRGYYLQNPHEWKEVRERDH